jgi:peptidyl-prolyl cis-trans isomerase D
MIFLFRKEIRKWNKVWWLVIAALAMGSVSFFFMKDKSKRDIKVATVNGAGISLQQFQQTFAEIKMSLDNLSSYWGVPVEQLARAMGIQNIAKSALEKCIQNTLLDSIADEYNMEMSDNLFQKTLGLSISKAFVDPEGNVNIDAYQNYLSRLHMTISDYEASQEKEFKRNLLTRCIGESAYAPKYFASKALENKRSKKSFSIITLPREKFVELAKKEPVTDKKLKSFFNEKKELFRIPEKRKARYWVVSPEEYKEKVQVDDELIEKFYEKNKTSLYRIPPKVKIRTIVFEVSKDATPNLIESARKKAEDAKKQLDKKPETFVKFTKKGGLIDYFSRGTHDPELERVAFLKLKEAGDISEIIRTERGFEIVKLEDRIPASSRPLSKVRNDIIKTLKSRKALFSLRGDFQAVVRTAREDKDIFDKFSKENKLETKQTGWLIDSEIKGYELSDVIKKKIFATRYKRNTGGYFVHQGKHILYQVTDVVKSSIPSFEAVRDAVRKDWYEQKAEKLQEKMAQNIKKELFAASGVEKFGFSAIKTPLIDINGKIDSIENSENLVQEAFSLMDPRQVLEHRRDTTYYIISLLNQTKSEVPRLAEEKKNLLNAEEMRIKRLNSDGFIASLQRDATINVRGEMFEEKSAFTR